MITWADMPPHDRLTCERLRSREPTGSLVDRFDAANRCPECGSRAASYKLHAHACLDVGAEGKHMHRQCPACAYEWAEATLTPRSAPAAQPEEPVDLVLVERDERVRPARS